MRVALISDIHANEVALCAVLDDIAKLGVDQIVCLGDVATLGPRPSAVISMLRELNCHCILGNHDAFLIEPELSHSYTEAKVVVQEVRVLAHFLRVASKVVIPGSLNKAAFSS